MFQTPFFCSRPLPSFFELLRLFQTSFSTSCSSILPPFVSDVFLLFQISFFCFRPPSSVPDLFLFSLELLFLFQTSSSFCYRPLPPSVPDLSLLLFRPPPPSVPDLLLLFQTSFLICSRPPPLVPDLFLLLF